MPLALPVRDQQANGRAAVTSGARGVTVAAPAGARPGGTFEGACQWQGGLETEDSTMRGIRAYVPITLQSEWLLHWHAN